jgi:hypothetical protein
VAPGWFSFDRLSDWGATVDVVVPGVDVLVIVVTPWAKLAAAAGPALSVAMATGASRIVMRRRKFLPWEIDYCKSATR